MMLPYPILYRDARFVVIDKPAGLAVHAGPRGGASVEDCFPALARKGKDGPWLAHRLDADTSGCLVIALRKTALLAAQAEFAAGRAAKTYWAVVAGRPEGEGGIVDAPLLRVTSKSGGWRMVVDPRGQRAVSEWRLRGVSADGALSWLEISPRTGRTHQVRVHCATLGLPILGDPIYGGNLTQLSHAAPLHLLARGLTLSLDPAVSAWAPPPPHMRPAQMACGWRPER